MRSDRPPQRLSVPGLRPCAGRWRAWFAIAAFALGAPAFAQNEACLACHGDRSLATTRDGKEVSLYVDATAPSVHADLGCVDCHAGFDADALPHREPMARAGCVSCHAELGTSHAFHPRIEQAATPGAGADTACAGCHGTHGIVQVKSPEFRFAAERRSEACGSCHQAQAASVAASAHFGPAGGPYPDCLTCHAGDVADGGQPALERKRGQDRLCLSCHVDRPETADKTRLGGKFVASWGSSVHGRAIAGGNAAAANCVDCHGSHEMKRAMAADSRVNKLHIPETCRTCHETAAADYARGVHAEALARGELESPVCTDCHGEHLILGTRDPASPVAPRNVSQQTCGECHGSVRLSEKYGISSDRFQTFADSFHGLAVRGGSVEVVTCASCHGAHAILASSNPASPVAKANLGQTCGQCHPGANELFALGSVHQSLAPTGGGGGDPLVQTVATIYVWAIVGIVGSMLLHNILDFFKKWRLKVRGHVFGVADEHVPHRLHLRMSASERLQHAALVISFVVLVATGFMLRHPEAWWVEGLRALSGNLFEMRGLVHRIAAVAMVLAGVWHGWYVACTARGRELLRALWPRWSDLGEMAAMLRYNLGLSRERPMFGRFSYIEKAEYWALLWGSILMTATGVLLWADETTMGLVGKLGFDVSRTIHYYEAVLASLAIVVWHFYFVIFNPGVYPMNLSWLTGYLSEKEMAEEHPRELERLRKLGVEGDS